MTLHLTQSSIPGRNQLFDLQSVNFFRNISLEFITSWNIIDIPISYRSQILLLILTEFK